MKWTKRVRSCSTIYYHPMINYQIIHYHNGDKIVFGPKEFTTVEEAKQYAEENYLW